MIASPKINVPPALLATLTEQEERPSEPRLEPKKSKREPWDFRFTFLILGLIFGVNFLLIFIMEHMPMPEHTRIGDEVVTEPMVLTTNASAPDIVSNNFRRTETYTFNAKDKAQLLKYIKQAPPERTLEDPLNLQAMKQRTLEQIIERKRASSLTAEELTIE